jgi:hypothetical protein
MQIDIFCRVIDNYGDIGVCWRLARQLVVEHGGKVRLIVDDLGAFRMIAPEIVPSLVQQRLLGVEVVKWSQADSLAPREIVIEAFACDPPVSYVEAMALKSPKPVWINLEYLSAESWVDEVHGLPSQHQRLPLTKYFFCPGFTPLTGGLIRESTTALVAICLDPRQKQSHHKPLLNAPVALLKTLRVFAFTYPHAPIHALTQAFTAAGVLTDVTVAATTNLAAPDWRTAAPVPQIEFDALLDQFDFLIVRGEDSFVRAQWAAKPFLWHIYPTADGAHQVKLNAWLDLYCVGLDTNTREAYRTASYAFNATTSDGAQSAPYELLAQNIGDLAAHALRWRDSLMQQTDLAARLVELIKTKRSL